MKKLLFIIRDLGSGGAQRQIVALAQGFKEKKEYDIQFLIFDSKSSQFYFQVLKDLCIKINIVNNQLYVKRIISYRKFIRSYKPDVVISFLEVSSFLAECAGLFGRKWRLIVGERSADPAKLISPKLKFFLHFHRYADYIVANSYANIEIIKKVAKELPDSKYRVIYNMLDNPNLTPDTDFLFRRSEQAKVVVASSHRALKNLDGLVEGVNLLPENLRSVLKISWYGNRRRFDDSYERAVAKIRRYGIEDVFEFHDDTLNVYAYMKQADAIGLFSFFEGLPNAICEGMMLAKPIIASRVSDVPLLIQDNETGFLCEAAEPRSIADALTRFLNTSSDKLEKMGQLNMKKAYRLFDKNKILNEYEKLF